MPLDFLTQAERQRYQVLPTSIAERDLRQHFHLNDVDRAFVSTFRGATSRLGVALHLGLLRYLGYLPEAWAVNVPPELRTFVAGQLPNGAQIDLAGYGSREASRTAHLQAALRHLGWSKWTPLEQGWLEPWLLERTLEHANERLLLDLACQKLRQHRLLRPAIGTLERLVSSLAEQTYRESFRRTLGNRLNYASLPQPAERDGHRAWRYAQAGKILVAHETAGAELMQTVQHELLSGRSAAHHGQLLRD